MTLGFVLLHVKQITGAKILHMSQIAIYMDD